jgi:hypothetical protein
MHIVTLIEVLNFLSITHIEIVRFDGNDIRMNVFLFIHEKKQVVELGLGIRIQ